MAISLICACKNRNESLQVALTSWLLRKEIIEFIIVDWSSDETLTSLTKLDSRIKIITVKNQKYFNQPQPLNLAASIATGNYILKVDCDYILNPYYNFFDSYSIDEKSFVSGKSNIKNYETFNGEEYVIDRDNMSLLELAEYVNSYSQYYRPLTGLLFVSRQNFQKVGGYNENLGKYYAYEDDEIFHRLRVLGLQEKRLNYDHHIFHIPHQDKKRIENFEGYNSQQIEEIKNTLNGDEKTKEWNAEYILKEKHIERNKQIAPLTDQYYVQSQTQWNLRQINEQNYDATIMMNDKLNGLTSVYYVSLEECENRRKSLEQQFKTYNISSVALISKRFAESNDNLVGKYLNQLNDGTKGCCVSHLKAIQKWYNETDENYGFFCEDDLSLETVEYWDFTWEEFLEKLPDDAECVQLFTIREKYDTFNLRERQWDDWGATAYILTRDYAQKLIDTYIQGNTFSLEIPNADIMPLIENILFASVGKTYTIPLFIENIEFDSTFVGSDDDVKEGQKSNHKIARELVLNYWKNKEVKAEIKTEIEELLTQYALDTENDELNFSLGIWYESQGHTAPAVSYYLRCAERSENSDLAYETLLRCYFCYEKQGERSGSSRSMLFQAQAFRPDRPEAYFLMSRYAEKREWWQDCYLNAHLALLYCNFNLPSLRTDVDYPGKYGLLFEKAIAAWWWGKGKETRTLLQEIKDNYVVSKDYFDRIQNTLSHLATGEIPEEEIKYSKEREQQLRFEFSDCKKVKRNYSQSFQDLFVLAALNGKTKGTYLEIGAQEPFYQNNTALLETEFEWNGISIEIDSKLCEMFSQQRKNKILCEDATKINYSHLLKEFNQGNIIDYLQLDCEPSRVTFEILLMIPFDEYQFRLITYEHDHYVDMTNSYRDKSRKYLQMMGYELLVSNVSLNDCSPFEDWWYKPGLIEPEIVAKMRNISDLTDVRTYMILK
jgi:hypothetical protein